MSTLNEVMTIAEIVREFDISERGVQKACERAAETQERWCRQSGATWLVLRTAAAERWKRKYDNCPECHGRGRFTDPMGDWYDCFRCRGSGKVDSEE